MKYLLDVNALLALRHGRSQHHGAFHHWAARVGLHNLATCAHSELGFLRISMQVFGYSLEDAQTALSEIKSQIGCFVAEAPSPKLPAWAASAARTSDAYLAQLATRNTMTLATFDTAIPGACLIR